MQKKPIRPAAHSRKPARKSMSHPGLQTPAPKVVKPPAPLSDRWFAVAAPGLEDLAEAEFRASGLEPTAVPGGVTFQMSVHALPARLPMLRLPNRLLLELGTWPVHAYDQVDPCIRRIDWTQFLHPFTEIEVQTSVDNSRVRFKDILKRKVEHSLKEAIKRPFIPDRERRPELCQRVHARLSGDQLTLSIDAAGEMLHRRGWRASVGEAPLRENLAAAMITIAGWSGQEPLFDPFCGSGTVPIEAALIALRRSPFTRSDFSCSEWPLLRSASWRLPPPPAYPLPVITGSDRDPKALAAAHDNSARAGVALRWVQSDVAEVELPGPVGWIITNPPYGQRMGEEERAYRSLGALLRRNPGWRALFLCPGRELAARVHPQARCLRVIPNGGLKIGIYQVG